MTTREVMESASTVVVAIVAICMLGLYIHDRGGRGGGGAADLADRHFRDWKDWAPNGLRTGPPDATVVVSTFVDFECPYCKSLAPVLDSVMDAYSGSIALDVHHFPLTSHKRAIPMAIAAECADRQGQFTEMYHALYAQADSTETLWATVASDAQISNVSAFEACTRKPSTEFPRIAAGLQLGKQLGVRGTPTVFVNGTHSTARSFEEFRALADELGAVRVTKGRADISSPPGRP